MVGLEKEEESCFVVVLTNQPQTYSTSFYTYICFQKGIFILKLSLSSITCSKYEDFLSSPLNKDIENVLLWILKVKDCSMTLLS